MPTEHEYKYVLRQDFLPETVEWDRVQHIEQGYLAYSKGMSVRVRHLDDGKKSKWFTTLKQNVKGRVVEIETKLDERDGQDLWRECVGKLKKDRHVVEHKGLKWEVDFFYNAMPVQRLDICNYKGDHLYFVMAEVELPEGASRPKEVPSFIKDHLLLEVQLTDDRFSNKRLGDAEYATKIYNELLKTPRSKK